MDTSQLQKNHFATLSEKYQAVLHENSTSDSFLYLILRKVELGIQINSLEFQWLKEHRLFKTVEIIYLQQYQVEDLNRLKAEWLALRSRYYIPEGFDFSISSPIYSILWKLDAGHTPSDLELKLLTSYDLVETINLIENISIFSKLKIIYKATKNLNNLPQEPIYTILKKLDLKEQLADSEADWLLDHDFEETLKIHWQQEGERNAIIDFLALKARYHIDFFPETSISSPLYAVLKKIKEKKELEEGECEWLERQNLTQLILIDQKRKDIKLFKKLKIIYRAANYPTSDPSSRLFLILRNIELQITGEDIQWLLNEGLIETATIVKGIHFKLLKVKYQILGKLAIEPFYEIMLKLERQERLEPKQVIQLIEENSLSGRGKIAIAYYKLEAAFYEEEYKRTGSKWNLPSASSNWRKACDPKNALRVTESVNWTKVQELDLKSALWVTRGAAFRDLSSLDEAENCATQAMDCQPDNHQPYTLLGAICYDRSKYTEGDNWFKMAVDRGANDTDDEIEKIVRMTKDKDKRREVVDYLIKKDPVRYIWANSYIK